MEKEQLTRGGLFAQYPLQKALEALIERSNGSTPVNIPEKLLFEEMAWKFPNGDIKDLNDCTKEELLDVCKVLVRKIDPVHDSLCHVRFI